MTKQDFTDLIEKGYITDITFVKDYMENPELADMTVEILMDKYIACQIGTPKESTPAPKPKFNFTITSDTPGAVITLNDEAKSTISVEQGTQVKWKVEAENYVTQEGTETINSEVNKKVNLEKVTYTITFKLTPEDATLRVDGQPCPTKSVTAEAGASKNYTATKEGFVEVTGKVTFDGNKEEKVTLSPNPVVDQPSHEEPSADRKSVV